MKNQHTNWLFINNLQRSRSKNDQSIQKERKKNQMGLKRRPVAVKVSKVVNCPLCPVRVSAIFLLDHFWKRHRRGKEEPSKEFHVRSAQQKEACQRIRRLFNKYSHKRHSHRDWLHIVKKMKKVCINSSRNTCNNVQGNFTISRVGGCNVLLYSNIINQYWQ